MGCLSIFLQAIWLSKDISQSNLIFKGCSSKCSGSRLFGQMGLILTCYGMSFPFSKQRHIMPHSSKQTQSVRSACCFAVNQMARALKAWQESGISVPLKDTWRTPKGRSLRYDMLSITHYTIACVNSLTREAYSSSVQLDEAKATMELPTLSRGIEQRQLCINSSTAQ